MASCVSCGDGKKKNDVTCCGSTVTETTTKVTKTGGALCDMPTGAVQYIGARYVPVFADPVEWTADRPYEHLMLVQNQGDTYISRQAVPVGIALDNADYWVHMSDWNAQIEQYREEVLQFDGRITRNAEGIEAEVAARIAGDNAINGRIDKIKNPYVGIIGDSFSDGANEWASMFSGAVGRPLINKAAGRSGFVTQNGVPFITQLGQISQDSHFDQCEAIIVYGGINDWNDAHATVDQMKSAFDAFLTAYKALSHKPRLIFTFGNIGMPRQERYNGFLYWYDECVSYLHSIGMPGIVENVLYWLFEKNGSAFNSDNLHPSAIGHAVISSYMEQVYNGTYTGVQFERTFDNEEVSTGVTNASGGVFFDNGTITITARATIEESEVPTGWISLNAGTNQSAWATGAMNEENALYPELAWVERIHANLADPTDYFRLHRLGFNRKNGHVYYARNFSNVPSEPTSFNLYTQMTVHS